MKKHYHILVNGLIGIAITAAALFTYAPAYSAGVISLNASGSAYSQNFDSLANTGTSTFMPNGWDFSETLVNANTTYSAGTGSGSAGDTYSFGTAASTERAFGTLQSTTLKSTIGAQFVNNTGAAINSLTISYTGEQWRLGAASRTDQLDFQFSTNAASLTTGTWTDYNNLDFVTPNTTTPTGAKDGNSAGNRTVISATISGLAIPNGATFWIRWLDLDIAGSDDGLAIDDFSLTPQSAPSVVSVLRAGANPTNAALVDFTVTFSRAVTGVGIDDFSIASGLTGTSVATISGSGTTYTVSVNTGSGSGTLRLNVTDDDSIIDSLSIPLGGIGLGNGNFNSGETYDIDRTAPVVTSSLRSDPSPTGASSVTFDVVFSKLVSGVNLDDFVLTTSGLTSVSLTNVVGAGANYTVTADTGTGSGTLRLDVVDDDSIIDNLTNPLGGVGINNGNYNSGESYTIDRVGPEVVSITRLDPDPTFQAAVRFNVIFSKSVTGVDISDFSINAPDLAGTSVISATGSLTTYIVTAGTGSGNGTLRLDVVDNDSIVDSLSNPLGGSGLANGDFSTGEIYTLDRSGLPTGGGLIVNEASNGSSGNREWMELVVIGDGATVDLTGWIIDDNNGDFGGFAAGNGIAAGHLRFASPIPACASGQSLAAAPVGSRIVLYNSAETEGVLAVFPNDPCDTNQDGVYYLPVGPTHNTSVLEECVDYPSVPINTDYGGCVYTSPANSWTRVVLLNTGDAAQVRMPDQVFYHGFAYGNVSVPPAPTFPNGSPSFNINPLTGTNMAYQFGCGDYFSNASNQFARINAGVANPGGANTAQNAVFLRSLLLGTYDFSNRNDIENCRIEPEVTITFLESQVAAGASTQLSVQIRNPYNTMGGFQLDLLGVQFTVDLPQDLLLTGVNPVSTTCGGTFSNPVDRSSFSLSGIALPSQAGPDSNYCTIIVNVVPTTIGAYTVEIPAGDVMSAALGVSGGANSAPSSTILQVTRPDNPDDPNGGLPNDLPATGFTPGVITELPLQPLDSAYNESEALSIEIPKLNLVAPVVGVPIYNNKWDVTWLGDNAGWLNSTTFPTWPGNSVISAHVWDSMNQPGPFAKLNQLIYGDQIIIHLDGEAYIFEVRSSDFVHEDNTGLITKDEAYPWISLVTCKDYEPQSRAYANRLVVRAVLVSTY